jgi:hypothetical protein
MNRSFVSQTGGLKNELSIQKHNEETTKQASSYKQETMQLNQDYLTRNHNQESRKNSHSQESSSMQSTKPNHTQVSLNMNDHPVYANQNFEAFRQPTTSNHITESNSSQLKTSKENHSLEPSMNTNKPNQKSLHQTLQPQNSPKLSNFQGNPRKISQQNLNASLGFEEQGVQCDLRPEAVATNLNEDGGQAYRRILQSIEDKDAINR